MPGLPHRPLIRTCPRQSRITLYVEKSGFGYMDACTTRQLLSVAPSNTSKPSRRRRDATVLCRHVYVCVYVKTCMTSKWGSFKYLVLPCLTYKGRRRRSLLLMFHRSPHWKFDKNWKERKRRKKGTWKG